MQNSDRVRQTDTPCLYCGEPLLVEGMGTLAADQSEPVGWAMPGLRWCWNGCQFPAPKIN